MIFIRPPKVKIFLPLLLVAFAGMLIVYPKFLLFIENRDGAILNDPLLSPFNPIDLTWLIFGILYGAILLGLFYFLSKPGLLVLALTSYFILIFLRMIAMYSVPLNPPTTTIILSDPIVEFFGTSQTLTKDLFFSGHTSLMFLLFLVAENKLIKKLFLAGTIIVGVAVILQHVHYSIDVIAAPFFTFVSYFLSKMICNYLFRAE